MLEEAMKSYRQSWWSWLSWDFIDFLECSIDKNLQNFIVIEIHFLH